MAARCLDQIVFGLVENTSLQDVDLILLARGLITESLPIERKASTKEAKEEKNKKRDKRLRPDGEHYLIPAEPGRAGGVPRSAAKTNTPLFVLAGFQLLVTALKRSKVGQGALHQGILDPFLEPLLDSMTNPHVKVLKT